jgi:hypothetical protein
MLDKKGFALFLLLLLLAALAAVPQDDGGNLWNRIDGLLNTAEERLTPAAGSTISSFTIRNTTGFVARSIFIRKAGETNWGNNILQQPLYNGQNISVRFDQTFDQSALYSVRMVDIDGDSYTKHNLNIRERSRVVIEIADFEWDK